MSSSQVVVGRLSSFFTVLPVAGQQLTNRCGLKYTSTACLHRNLPHSTPLVFRQQGCTYKCTYTFIDIHATLGPGPLVGLGGAQVVTSGGLVYVFQKRVRNPRWCLPTSRLFLSIIFFRNLTTIIIKHLGDRCETTHDLN